MAARRTISLVVATARRTAGASGVASTRSLRRAAPIVSTSRQLSTLDLTSRRDVDVFPDERPGNHYDVNWSLCADDIPPKKNAWYNYQKDDFLEQFGAKVGTKDIPLQKVGEGADFIEFSEFYENLMESMGNDDIFVHDGGVGSFRDATHRVRIISDNPAYALEARKMLMKVRIKEVDAPRDIVVYISTKAEAPESNTLWLPAGEPAKLVITGSPSFACLMKNVLQVSDHLLAAQGYQDGVLLPADVLRNGDKTALVFGASDSARKTGLDKKKMYAAHNAIWSAKGLSAYWGGAALSSGSKNVSADNLVAAPSEILFVGEGSKSLSSSEAAGLLKSKYGLSEAAASQVETLINQSNASARGVREGDLANF